MLISGDEDLCNMRCLHLNCASSSPCCIFVIILGVQEVLKNLTIVLTIKNLVLEIAVNFFNEGWPGKTMWTAICSNPCTRSMQPESCNMKHKINN